MQHPIRRAARLPLTKRQQEVLSLFKNTNLTRKQAAAALGISYQSIHQHISNLLARLNVPTLAEARQLDL